jgi:hypothetical protein
VSTSVYGRNRGAPDPFAIERLGVRRGDRPEHVLSMVQGAGLADRARRFRASSLDLAKRLLGNRRYVAVRRWALAAMERIQKVGT